MVTNAYMICQGRNVITPKNKEKKIMTKYEGKKHTRFSNRAL